MRNQLVIGILAHVDAGKTTLSESLLYLSGKIGKLGRVDKRDAYLDNYDLERERGITIFSKQAVFEIGETKITLLDTPGHVDFSAEMERTLRVLDYAILVISGSDGIQGHTKTLWRLLDMYEIPRFIFINKMDQEGTDKDKLLEDIKTQLHDGCIDFGQIEEEETMEQVAMCDERLLETYLESGKISKEQIKGGILSRKIFPCFFGSALRLEGVQEFMKGIEEYSVKPEYPSDFSGKIFKITRDEQGNRLTHMKITGGVLRVKDQLSDGVWEEKVNQIRIYSGLKYEAIGEATAGTICAVTGLTLTKAGEELGSFGALKRGKAPVLEPVLSYRVILPDGLWPSVLLPKLYQIEEEETQLHITWNEELQEIGVQLMGEVQVEILEHLLLSRFGVKVSFGEGKVVYKETIKNTVEGVGHFEPLRHYAEVHLLLEPGEPGSGLVFETKCSEDIMGKNWQNLVLTHLEEKVHRGVLTGSPITDMKISLVSGRSHNKHTEGGDFREATYRAVRQGLMEAESVLLEPYYSFQLELPQQMVGRAMADIEKMHGVCQLSGTNHELALLTGKAPVLTMRNYQKEVTAYTKGEGKLFCTLKGYEPCHNLEEVMERIGYDPELDFRNPTSSVFCSHGSGFVVPWYEVKNYMHLEGYLSNKGKGVEGADIEILSPKENTGEANSNDEIWIDLDEIDAILNRTYHANQGKKGQWKKTKTARESYYESGSKKTAGERNAVKKEEYLLVDGYNIIFSWEDLKELADTNMDGAKIKLAEVLSNYKGIKNCHVILVFDAYRVQGHPEEVMEYQGIHIVYTREAQTADQYIEQFAHDNSKKYNITVATSDGLQQIIIRGAGAFLLSARDLKAEIEAANENSQLKYREGQEKTRNHLLDNVSPEIRKQMEDIRNEK